MSVLNVVPAQPTRDGDGVRINRVIGSGLCDHFDPFLLLDEIRSDDSADYIGGFPPHPHRGFETVTYMIEGRMRHRDSEGNSGVIETGGVQWMTAGRGILHSEMPEQTEGRLWGFQLWVNLPAEQKMRVPRYQEFGREQIPEVSLGQDCRVRVIAGECQGVKGPVDGIELAPLLLDVALPAGQSCDLALNPEQNTVVYVFSGSLNLAGQAVASQSMAMVAGDPKLLLTATEDTRALVISASALNEPVARYGPFVMNNQAQIKQAVSDYQMGRFGQM